MKIHQPYQDKLNKRPDFIVEYQFLTSEEGERITGTPYQGYRSDFWYKNDTGNENQIFMIWPEFLDENSKVIMKKESHVPISGKANMWIINDEMRKFHQERIKVGLNGFFMEGPKKVAKCTVIKIEGLMN